MDKYLKYKNKYIKYKNTMHGGDNTKWLVLDVDDCLYPPKYDNNTKYFVSSFVNVEKKFTKRYLDLIKKRCEIKEINTNNDDKNLKNLREYLMKKINSFSIIIGLFMELKKLDIPIPIDEYHNSIECVFPYDKIVENVKIITAIEIAKNKKMKCAIFSNGSCRHILRCLEKLNLSTELFDHISCLDFLSETVIQDLKPHVNSYCKFQNEINAKSENIFFFDDSINNCTNACESGWNAILVNKKIPNNVTSINSPIDILTNTSENKIIYQIDSISNINFIIH